MPIEPSLTSWAYTVVFAATGAASIVAAIGRRGPLTRLMFGLHVLMSAGMIGMAWSAPVPSAPAIAVYAAATLLLVVLWARSIGPRGRPIADHPSWMIGFHAAMMAAMVWMSLPGGHAVHDPAGGGAMDHGSSMPDVPLAIGLALTVAMIAGTGMSAVEAALCSVRRPPNWRVHVADDALTGLMGLGMTAMMLGMVLA